MNATVMFGIASILVAFCLFATSFYMTTKGRKKPAIVFGVVAFLFMTIIPVSLALFGAVPNPT